MEPPIGFEPMTVRLQGECSTSWAMVALFCFARHILLKNLIKSKLFLKKNYFLDFFAISILLRVVI